MLAVVLNVMQGTGVLLMTIGAIGKIAQKRQLNKK